MQNDVPCPDPTPDEIALLREALAFIGDFGVEGDGISPRYVEVAEIKGGLWSPLDVQPAPVSALKNDEPPPLVSPARGSPKRKGNRSRNKRREELLYLRDMVGDLESKLLHMKRQGSEQQLLEAPGHEARSSLLVRAAWEQVATRQAEERQRAEMENIRLKRVLEEQIQVGKSLERLLRKRPKLEDAGQKYYAEKRPRLDISPSSWDDALIFQELLASSEAQYVETPRVLAKVLPLMEGQPNDRKVELVRDDDLGMVMRATESRILPFGLELATQEFWKAIPDLANARASGARNIEKSDNLIKAKFRAHVSFGRMHGDFTVFIVDRRFCESHRTVITSSAVFDPTEISDMKMDGIYMRHKSWIIFEPIVPDADRPQRPTKAATRMMSYSITAPQVFDGLEEQSHKVGTLTNFLMSAISVELELRQQEFENRLFDRMCDRAVK